MQGSIVHHKVKAERAYHTVIESFCADIIIAIFNMNYLDMSDSVFPIDACRAMIAMLDVSSDFCLVKWYRLLNTSLQWDKNGTLNYPEFESLLKTIALWKVCC